MKISELQLPTSACHRAIIKEKGSEEILAVVGGVVVSVVAAAAGGGGVGLTFNDRGCFQRRNEYLVSGTQCE